MRNILLEAVLLCTLLTVVQGIGDALLQTTQAEDSQLFHSHGRYQGYGEDDMRRGTSPTVDCIMHHCRRVKGVAVYACALKYCLYEKPTPDPDTETENLPRAPKSSSHQLRAKPPKSSLHELSAKRSHPHPKAIRSKRWQYSDPLQLCVASKCHGHKGAHFYSCVYEKCIADVMR